MNDRNELDEIHMEYKYDDADVNGILDKIKETELSGDVINHAPIAAEDNNLIEFLVHEKNVRRLPDRTLLIPYLLGCRTDGHWVGIVVRFKNDTVQNVEYYDSMTSDSMINDLKEDLKQIYGNGIVISEPKDHTIKLNDFSACGPCMIENLINAAVKGDYPSNQRSPREIREYHISLLGRTFYEKQKENVSNSATTIFQQPYHIQSQQEINSNPESDFDYLRKIRRIAQDCINKSLDGKTFCDNLTEISELIDKISHNNKDKTIIRNKHGYRNASRANEINTNGAKLDFNLLSYLKSFIENDKFKEQLKQTDLIDESLKILIDKIDCISQDDRNSKDSPSSDLGFLGKIIAHYHNVDCLQNLLKYLNRIDEEWWKTLDPANEVNTYALGYCFVEFGETANSITDLVQPQQARKENLIRAFLHKLYAFRNVLKNRPKVVRIGQNFELFQMKILIEEVRDDLVKLIKNMLKRLNNIDDMNANFHEFDPNDSNLSKFEREHKELIVYLNTCLRQRNVPEILHQAKKKLLKQTKHTIGFIKKIDKSKLSKFTADQRRVVEFVTNLIEFIKTNNIDDTNLTTEQKDLLKQVKQDGVKVSNDSKLKKTFVKLMPLLDDCGKSIKNVEQMINDRSKLQSSWLISEEYYDEMDLDLNYEAKLIDDIENDKARDVLKKVLEKSKEINIIDNLIDNKILDQSTERIIEILKEIKFLRKLFTAHKSEDDEFKSIQAAKMSLGLIGQLFRNFKEDCKNEKLQGLLLKGSIILDDCKRAIEMRNKEIMHNVVHCKLITDDMLKLIEHRIVPWYKDFIAMSMYLNKKLLNIDFARPMLKNYDDQPSCFYYDLALQYFDNKTTTESIDDTLEMNFIEMVALNRLSLHEAVLNLYEVSIKPNILEINKRTISTPFYCELANAYRSLGKYKEAADIVDRYLTDEINWNLHLYMGAMYTTSNLVKAIRYTEYVIFNSLHSDYISNLKGYLAANVLLSNIVSKAPNIFSKRGYFELSKSFIELIFIQFFDGIRKQTPVIAVYLLNQLLAHYNFEFNRESFEDCFDLCGDVLNDFRREIIDVASEKMAREEYFLNYRRVYDIIDALIKGSDDELETIYRNLQNEKHHMNCMRNLCISNCFICIIPVAILLKKPPNEIECIKNIERKCSSEVILEQMNIEESMRDLIAKLMDRSTIAAECNDETELIGLKIKMLGSYQSLAIQFYLNEEYDKAREAMRRRYLFESIVDFLKSKVTEFYSVERSEEDKHKFVSDFKIDNDDILIKYLKGERFNQNHSDRNNIIRRYKNTQSDQAQRKELIIEYGNKLVNATENFACEDMQALDTKNDKLTRLVLSRLKIWASTLCAVSERLFCLTI